jgi:hypothetical protein
VGCCSYKLYRFFQTPHSFSVTIFTLGLRLFFILLQINLTISPRIYSSAFCTGLSLHAQDPPSLDYASNILMYNLQVGGTRQWTQCKYSAKDPAGDWLKYFPGLPALWWFAVPTITQYKKIQFYDYTFVKDRTNCVDFVSESCVDNAFSFFGKACRWVHESQSSGGLSLTDLLKPWPVTLH